MTTFANVLQIVCGSLWTVTSLLGAVDYAYSGVNVDYAMLLKVYGESAESEMRYSPAQCIGCKRRLVVGDPDPDHISMSFVERQNSGMPWATGAIRD